MAYGTRKIELTHRDDYLTAYATDSGDHVIVRNPRKRSEWLALRSGEYVHPANAIAIAQTRTECLERLSELTESADRCASS